MFTLPLVNIHQVKRWLSSWKTENTKEPEIHALDSIAHCPACEQAAVIPQKSACGHTFCYYCLTVRMCIAIGRRMFKVRNVFGFLGQYNG